MKKAFLLFSTLLLFTSLRAENTNENVGAWSDAVSGLRGRLIVAHGDKFGGIEWLKVYLELENVSDTLGSMEIDPFDYQKTLKCDLHDDSGHSLPGACAADYFMPVPTKLFLPLNSSLRLYITTTGVSPCQKGGWFIGLYNGSWGADQENHKDYFLEGVFHLDQSTNRLGRQWSGTLKLPKVKVLRE